MNRHNTHSPRGRRAAVVVAACSAALALSSTGIASAVTHSASAKSSAAPTAAWSSAKHIDTQTIGRLDRISCVSKSFCVAIESGGAAVVEQGGKWTAPTIVATSHNMVDVSCVSSSFCMATDSRGGWYEWTGHSWTGHHAFGAKKYDNPNWVSCPTAASCVALSKYGQSFRWNGKKWTIGPVTPAFPNSAQITGLSCPTSTVCYASEYSYFEDVSSGTVATLQGGAWTAPASPLSDHGVFGVSCVAPGDCVANQNQNALVLSGATWTPSTLPVPVEAIDCVTAQYCLAVTTTGQTTKYDGTSWSTPTKVVLTGSAATNDAFLDVSCPGVNVCTAIAPISAAVASASGLTDVKQVEKPSGGITSISCATPSFCVAVDRSGQVMSMHGTTWSAPKVIDAKAATFQDLHGRNVGFTYVAGGLQGVSCATTKFCLAVDSLGRAYRYNGHSWSGPKQIAAKTFAARSVSCASPKFCMLLTGAGASTIYNGKRFSTPAHAFSGASLTAAVSCPTTKFCGVLNDYQAITWTNGKWHSHNLFKTDNGESGLSDIACASSSYCLAVRGSSPPFVYDGKTWKLRSGAYGAAVSCGSITSCLGVSIFGAMTLGKSEKNHNYKSHPDTRVSCPTSHFCEVASDNRLGSVQRVTLH